MKLKTFVVFVIVSVMVSGCATIMHGNLQEINFLSSPEGAMVKVDGVDVGKTPIAKELSRKSTHVVHIVMPGYETYEMKIEKKVSGWLFGNIIFGGIVGLIVDAATGSLYNLTPEQVAAEFEKADVAQLYKDDSLYVAVTLHPDSSWKKIGELTPNILN